MKIAVNITPLQMFTATVPDRHILDDMSLIGKLAQVNKHNASKGKSERIVFISNRVGGFVLPNKR